MHVHRFFSGLLIACLLLAVGCNSSSRLDRHLSRAESYRTSERYDAAIIEYLNVLRLDPANPAALRGLSMAHAAAGNFRDSIPFTLAAAEALPEDIELQANAGAIYLLTGQHAQARLAAERILAAEPDALTGYLILADASRSADEATQTLERLNEQEAQFGSQAAFHAFRAELLLRADRFSEADAALQQAIAISPEVARVHLALGRLKRATGDIGAASEAFMRAAALAPEDPIILVAVAQFKLQQGETEEARTILETSVARRPDSVAARIELARIEAGSGQFDAALQLLDAVDELVQDHPEARHLRARVKWATGLGVEARALLEPLARIKADDPRFLLDLALARAADQDTVKAIEALDRAVDLDPGFVQARLLRAELRIRNGSAAVAIQDLRALLDAEPDLDRARLLLAAAYRAEGRHAAATGIYRTLIDQSPGSGHRHYLLAASLLAEGERDKAQEQLERALQLTPEHLPALNMITEIDVRQNRSDAALARLEARLAQSPDVVALHYLRGVVLYIAEEHEAAEEAFRRVIERDARMLDAYVMLGRLLSAMGHLDEAIEKLDTAIASSPANPGPLMLAAVLESNRGNQTAAIARYEQIIQVEPDFYPALNNLAILLGSDATKLDRAHDLAMRARQIAPDNPFVSDTLGWIAYRRGDYRWAYAMLREAAAGLADFPEVHYHLGMAQAMLGFEAEATASLTRALSDATDFDGRQEAAALLAVLAIDPDTITSEDMPKVEALLSIIPSHPSALLRRAALAARTGDPTEALAQAALIRRANPHYFAVLPRMARFHVQVGDDARALEAARDAHAMRTDNVHVQSLLGWMAYRNGQFAWAASLLDAASDQLPGDAITQYRAGRAALAMGRVDAARQHLSKALEQESAFEGDEDARLTLRVLDLAASPEPETALDAVRAALDSNPEHPAALYALAALQWRVEPETDFIATAERLLEHYPLFLSIAQDLAHAYLRQRKNLPRAWTLARQVREARPDDPVAARLLGQLAHLREEHAYAVTLLVLASQGGIDDAETLYMLGLSLQQAGREADAIPVLKKALEADPEAAQAQTARAIIGTAPQDD